MYTYQNITLYNLKYLEIQQINKHVHTQLNFKHIRMEEGNRSGEGGYKNTYTCEEANKIKKGPSVGNMLWSEVCG